MNIYWQYISNIFKHLPENKICNWMSTPEWPSVSERRKKGTVHLVLSKIQEDFSKKQRLRRVGFSGFAVQTVDPKMLKK